MTFPFPILCVVAVILLAIVLIVDAPEFVK